MDSNPTAGMSRTVIFIHGRNLNGFPEPKMFRTYSPTNKITLWPIWCHVIVVKEITFKVFRKCFLQAPLILDNRINTDIAHPDEMVR